MNSLGNNSAMMDKHVNYSEFNLQLLLFGAFSSQPELEAWCGGLSGSALILESHLSLHTANTWEAGSGATQSMCSGAKWLGFESQLCHS